MIITFDPVLHEYRHNGIIIPSVTQILKEAGYINSDWYSAEARDRGSAVHDLCERYIKGIRQDDIGRLLENLEYVNAFSSWINKVGAYPIETECLVHNTINGKMYGGKFDLLCEIKGKRILVDYKTGAKAKWHPLQLAGYSLASFEDGSRVNPDGVAALYLKADGTYKFDCVPGMQWVKAIAEFKACL